MMQNKNELAYENLRKILGEKDSSKIMVLRCTRAFECGNFLIEKDTLFTMEPNQENDCIRLETPSKLYEYGPGYACMSVLLKPEFISQCFAYDRNMTEQLEKIDEFQTVYDSLNEQLHSADRQVNIHGILFIILAAAAVFVAFLVFSYSSTVHPAAAAVIGTIALTAAGFGISTLKANKKCKTLLSSQNCIEHYMKDAEFNLLTRKELPFVEMTNSEKT